jgi:uncharacterized Zn-binding protein involved in type VI secretion
MSRPAARLGDTTAHGGTITVGFPTVLIGGVPAARVGDMHVCPLVNPGTPPPPHVGGPVQMGSPTVLIGGMPAARMGDMVVCAGPPDVIVLGCPTVLIGDAGMGTAAGGGAGMNGVAAAHASAAAAQFDNIEASTKEEHWIEFEFVDAAGLPVSGVTYRFEDPESKESVGVLRIDGKVRRSLLAKGGTCQVTLMSISDAKWSKEKAEAEETVKLSAKAEGFEDGTKGLIQIMKRDITGPDVVVSEIETDVQGDKVESEWKYEVKRDDEVIIPAEGEAGNQITLKRYSAPEYYFEVIIGPCKARSGMLYEVDYVEIEVCDEGGQPLGNEEYIIYSSSGEVRRGQLDGNGYAREDNLPAGSCSVHLPNLPEIEYKD